MASVVSGYLFLFFLLRGQSFPQEEFSGKCVGVIDGDTIDVLRNGRAVRIRLEGIDCPERGQDFGSRAKQFTSGLVFGKTVNVKVKEPDRYGRLVARVIAQGKDLSHELVKAGLAWHFKKYSSDLELAQLEDKVGKPGWESGRCRTRRCLGTFGIMTRRSGRKPRRILWRAVPSHTTGTSIAGCFIDRPARHTTAGTARVS